MLIIIQARLSSTRLPGKVLKELEGKPLLQWTVDRLKILGNEFRIIVATSAHYSDDALFNYCKDKNINCYRGSLNNVLSRIIEACKLSKSRYLIRICADSPIIDHNIILKAIKVSKEVDFDIVTNTFKRTYPKGQSVELIKLSSLEKLSYENLTSSEKEHVTEGFYNRSNKYKVFNFESNEENLSNLQLSVDTYDDYERIGHLIRLEKKEKKNFYSWQKFANLFKNYYGKD